MMSEDDEYNVTYDYYFYGNITDGMYEFYAVPQIVFVSLLCAFIIVGNACVLAAIRLSENGRKSRMNFFIMHLAIADLLVGVGVSLTDLITKITVEWYGGTVMCKLVTYSQTVVTYSSTYVLVSLSLDRYDAVARPMNFSRSGYRGRFLVFGAWLVALLFALPTLFLHKEVELNGRMQCWLDFPEMWHWQLFVTAIAIVTFLLPAIIIATCYIAIIYIIWCNGRGHSDSRGQADRRSLNSSGNNTPTITRLTISDSRHETGRGIIPQAKIRTIKMTLIIVIVFILCWSPFFIYNLLDVYGNIPKNNPMTTLIQSAAPLNSAANPIIYGIFSTRICKNLRRIPLPPCLRKVICRCKEKGRTAGRSFRGRSHQYLTSQTTDPTMTTFDANRRCHTGLNDFRLSPLKAGSLRCHSTTTKPVFDRGLILDNVEISSKKETEKKTKLFKIRGRKWSSSDKKRQSPNNELAPLTKSSHGGNQGSSGSDESSHSSDLNVRQPRLNLDTKCSPDTCHENSLLKKALVNDSSKFSNFVNVKGEESGDNSDVDMTDRGGSTNKLQTSGSRKQQNDAYNPNVDNNPADHEGLELNCCYNERLSKEIQSDFSFERDWGKTNGIHTALTHIETHEANTETENDSVFSETSNVDANCKCSRLQNRHSSLKESNLKERCKGDPLTKTDGVLSEESLLNKGRCPVRERADKGGAYGGCATNKGGVSERCLANRRPSGVPTVRRRLTSDENIILHNVKEMWLMNDLTPNESSIMD